MKSVCGLATFKGILIQREINGSNCFALTTFKKGGNDVREIKS